jgi:hypothetical protein
MAGFSDSIDTFHLQAREARRLGDFGDDDYHEALRVLCRSLDEDASLTPIGNFAVEAMIVDALEARLLVEEGHRLHPEAADARIERPLVIVGLPRTGTTALHHLIGQDPAFQGLEHWLARSPKPRPPRADWEEDGDYLAAVERLRMIYERSPDMRAIHEIEADLPDECWNLFSQNFSHSSWQANVDVHQYARWWSDYDMTPTYRRHRRNAQLIGHREPDRRWLFKDATHLFDLNALLEVYPDALIVQTHRDPVELIPSVCSLCWSSRSAINVGTDLQSFARSTLDLWERAIRNMMKARAGRDPSQFFDLSFEHFVADPVAAIREIYEAFGIEYSAEADAMIRAFREANLRAKHGEHSYTVEEWGLDASEIAERFAEYVEAHDVRM